MASKKRESKDKKTPSLDHYLILPLYIGNIKDGSYNSAWNSSKNKLITSTKTVFENCFIGRKEWLFDLNNDMTNHQEKQQQNISFKFLKYIESIKENQVQISKFLTEYLNFSTESIQQLFSDDELSVKEKKELSEKIGMCTATDRLGEILTTFSTNKSFYSDIITYQRKIKDQNIEFTWVLIKVGTHFCKFKDLENDIFKKFLDVFGSININPSIPTRNKNLTDNYMNEPIDRSKKEIYLLQRKIGNAIFDQIAKFIEAKNYSYDSFRTIFLTPPRNSLLRQTKERIDSLDFQLDNSIMMADKKHLPRFKKLISDAKKNKKCLCLIVQDECHWGMLKESTLHKYLDLDLLDSQNIFLLQVSATPYNVSILTKMGWSKDKTILWDGVAESDESFKEEYEKYNGLSKLLSNKKILSQSKKSYECMNDHTVNLKEIGHIFANKEIMGLKTRISNNEISILIEYLVTLNFILDKRSSPGLTLDNEKYKYLKDFITDETTQILEVLTNYPINNGKGNLVVLRMNNFKIAQNFQIWMQNIRDKFGNSYLFDVILDANTTEDEENLWGLMSSESKKKYQEWRGINTEPKKINYSDLIYLPILLIVIEKGRMGDTFPANFKYFDLRCRYSRENANSTTYASFIQDLGRAFGYGERPKVFLSKFIFDKLDSKGFILKPHETLELEKEAEDSNQKAENSDQEAENSDLETENSDLETENSDLETENSNLETENSNLETENSNLLPNLQSNNSENDFDKNDLLNLNEWKAGKKHQMNGIEDNIIEQKTQQRFLLSAHPQNGKTGAFLWAIKLLNDKYNLNKQAACINNSILDEPASSPETRFLEPSSSSFLIESVFEIAKAKLRTKKKDNLSSYKIRFINFPSEILNSPDYLRLSGFTDSKIQIDFKSCNLEDLTDNIKTVDLILFFLPNMVTVNEKLNDELKKVLSLIKVNPKGKLILIGLNNENFESNLVDYLSQTSINVMLETKESKKSYKDNGMFKMTSEPISEDENSDDEITPPSKKIRSS